MLRDQLYRELPKLSQEMPGDLEKVAKSVMLQAPALSPWAALLSASHPTPPCVYIFPQLLLPLTDSILLS